MIFKDVSSVFKESATRAHLKEIGFEADYCQEFVDIEWFLQLQRDIFDIEGFANMGRSQSLEKPVS